MSKFFLKTAFMFSVLTASLSQAATFETCHQIKTPQIDAKLSVYSLVPGYTRIDKLLGNFYANQNGRIKIDGLAPGLYKFVYFIGGKIVQDQNKAIIDGYNWLDCNTGLIVEDQCGKASVWVTECLGYNPGTSTQQCVSWCKSENPPTAGSDHGDSEITIDNSGAPSASDQTGDDGFIIFTED